MDQPATFTPAAVTSCALRPRREWLGGAQALRAQLDALPAGRAIRLSADEWGLGPPWAVERFSVPHALYAAAFLGAA